MIGNDSSMPPDSFSSIMSQTRHLLLSCRLWVDLRTVKQTPVKSLSRCKISEVLALWGKDSDTNQTRVWFSGYISSFLYCMLYLAVLLFWSIFQVTTPWRVATGNRASKLPWSRYRQGISLHPCNAWGKTAGQPCKKRAHCIISHGPSWLDFRVMLDPMWESKFEIENYASVYKASVVISSELIL